MNFIIEERNNIITTNNSAQEAFESILNKIDSSIEELIITEELNGDIDLSPIKDQHRQVHTIIFRKGKITKIHNIPNQLHHLEVSEQLLVDFPDLTPNLVKLNIEKNYIERLNFDDCRHLACLNISNNRFEELNANKIPETLEELYCDNNIIKQINLEHLIYLRILHITNNKLIEIFNIPSSLVDLRTSDNPQSVKLNYKNQLGGTKKTNIQNINQDVEDKINIIDYNEALTLFFTMRKLYFAEFNKAKRTALTNQKIKQKQKRKLEAESIIPMCMSCNRKVGNVFSTKNFRYSIKCGDNVSPCDFHIELYRGETQNVDKMLEDLTTVKNSMQQSIIESKLKMIFNYESESNTTKIFNDFVREYSMIETEYKKYLQLHNEFYIDESRQHLLLLKQNKLREIKDNIHNLMVEYEKNRENHILLQKMVTVQIQQFIPELKNIRALLFEQNEIERIPIIRMGNEDEWSYFKLNQHYAHVSKMENIGAKQCKVVKWSVPNTVMAAISRVNSSKLDMVTIPI